VKNQERFSGKPKRVVLGEKPFPKKPLTVFHTCSYEK
jgi:hypothetical protein